MWKYVEICGLLIYDLDYCYQGSIFWIIQGNLNYQLLGFVTA